ncbi:cupredoxin family copper-binding protein [Octadecabacter sp. 1_MG-2023]|uniref:cupredoxin domain-containing protein n=1 Tax=unclassified Octadecabacter TaxID=196158 RepID=UPI001C09A7B8|nr:MULTISPECIES: cupredoxin family copper-binding protein [unclassified Octadecabacter]MBU2993480.1 cupredoxin family copper-binding protein [Octadecabacter sp. B2R22]MDO6733064.1 cupredoxin family copper-binding protein [Octadecabacter sp. 1_MG-2023]
MTKTRREFMHMGAATLAALPVLATTAQAQTTHTVTIKNMQFSPPNLTVSVGDTITWVNEDRVRHSAWESNGNNFDTGLIGSGESASLTFGSAGTFDYRCRPHGNMRGSITVS